MPQGTRRPSRHAGDGDLLVSKRYAAVHELLKVWEDLNRGDAWREVATTGSDQARAPS